jgi:hypothetical protein
MFGEIGTGDLFGNNIAYSKAQTSGRQLRAAPKNVALAHLMMPSLDLWRLHRAKYVKACRRDYSASSETEK